MGRAHDNDLVVTTAMVGWDTVSRHHARLYYNNHRGRWVVKDEGSSNGTYVDGVRTGHNVCKMVFELPSTVWRQCFGRRHRGWEERLWDHDANANGGK